MSVPTAVTEYAFSGSLCRIRAFETADGFQYCLTVFSLSDYKHLHFPHEEYKWLISKLSVHFFTETVACKPNVDKLTDALSIKMSLFYDDFKINFEEHCLTIGKVTAFGLVNSTPFAGDDIFSVNKSGIACDYKWDVCTCNACPALIRLLELEADVLMKFPQRKVKNVILFQEDKQ